MEVYYPVTRIHTVTFLGEDEEPVMTTDGYAILEYEEDENGNRTYEGYYDTIKAPINCAEGYASVERGYDGEGRLILHVDRNGNRIRTTYNVDGNPVMETGTDRNGENTITRSWEYDTSGRVKKAVAGGFCYTYEYRADGKLLKKSSSGRTLLS